jgi:hypothetical protein
VGRGHQLIFLKPVVGLRQLVKLFSRTDDHIIGGLQTPLSQQAHTWTFKNFCHNEPFLDEDVTWLTHVSVGKGILRRSDLPCNQSKDPISRPKAPEWKIEEGKAIFKKEGTL